MPGQYVNIPDVSKCDVRPKDNPSVNIILEPLLVYIHYTLQSGMADNIKRAVTGSFTEEVILEAKEVLFNQCDADVIGPIKHRRDGDT
jgi:hypothetical protein